MGFLRRFRGSAPKAPATRWNALVVNDEWVCGACLSINPHGTDACASCRHTRGSTDVDFSGLDLGSPTDPGAMDLAAWLSLSAERRDAMDPKSTAAWLNLSREKREELAVGLWLMHDALAPPGSRYGDSEEATMAAMMLQSIANGTRSWILTRVLGLLREQGVERMAEVFLRVAGIRRGDSPSRAVVEGLPEPDTAAALKAVFATTRGVLLELPENDRRRFGAAVGSMVREMVMADSGPQSMPRDKKVIRAANILDALGIDLDADVAWVKANGY